MVIAVEKYKALANECRLRLVNILIHAGTPLCICEMMDALEKEQYQISRCLSALKDAALVTEERDGRLIFFALDASDAVNRALFASVHSIDREAHNVFTEDLERLRARLAKRENGKVIVTYCCP